MANSSDISATKVSKPFDITSVTISLPNVATILVVFFGGFYFVEDRYSSKVDVQRETAAINKKIVEINTKFLQDKSEAESRRSREEERALVIHTRMIESLQTMALDMAKLDTNQKNLLQQGSVGPRRGWDSKESSDGHE